MAYYNPYNAGQPPSQQQNYYPQQQRQQPPYVNQVQVIAPPRQSVQSPSSFHPQYNANQHYQYQQQYQPQLPVSHHQPNAYYPQQSPVPSMPVYNGGQQPQTSHQYNQHYQPPPPPPPQNPMVMVPPLPSQSNRQHQNQSQARPENVRQYRNDSNQQPPQPSRILQDSKQTKQPQQNINPQPKASPAPPISTPKPVPSAQYPSLLLTLADEYMDASRKLPDRSKEYYQLVSTAIGCMDVALRNFKLEPLREAQLSLKYAQTLYDETNNLDEAETTLTKSIDLCDRMKFIDLKYAMQLLLAKVLYRSKPRAAIRDLQGMIQDVETYRHTAWEYPFRFQAAFCLADTATHANLNEAIHQLERIQHSAKMNNDHGIYAYAATIESLLHLHTPGADAIIKSQRALAKARSLQLNPDVDKHPQIPVLMDIIDLIWSIGTANESEIAQKRKILKDSIYTKSIDNPSWARDESTWLKINSASLKGIATQEGGLIHELDGRHYMALSWMGKKELEALGFLLMGVALIPQNQLQRNKAESFLNGGYPVVKDEMLDRDRMLSGKDERVRQRCHSLCMHFKIETALLCCNQGKWKKAREIAQQAQSHYDEISSTVPEELESLLAYLKGCIAQGTGDLTAALNIFSSKSLAIQAKQQQQSNTSKTHAPTPNHTVQTLRILAAMNTALIIRSPQHPQHNFLQSLIDTIGTHINQTSPALLSSSYSLLLATLPSSTVLQMKQLLNTSLETARKIANNQIISLTLTLMQDRFFRGGVQHAQAVKCAKAATHQVKTRWGSPLWMAVAEMMEVESLLLQGDPATMEEMEVKQKDVTAKRAELGQVWVNVPEAVKRAMAEDASREEQILRGQYGM